VDAPSLRETLDGYSAGGRGGLENIFGSPVHLGDIEPAGDCTPPDEAAVDRRARSGIRSCLESASGEATDNNGTVDLRWTVNSDGSVSSASVEDSELDDADLEQCIADVFGELSFPDRDGDACELRQSVELRQQPKMRTAFSGVGRRLLVGRDREPEFGTKDIDGSDFSSEFSTQVSTESVHADGCSTSEVESTLQNKNAAVTYYCYKMQLSLDPEMSGTSTIDFEIDAEGRISSIDTSETTLDSDKADACLRWVLKHARYPEPDGGSCEVQATFKFTRK